MTRTVCCLVAVYAWIGRPASTNKFPVWAVIEIALTGFLIPRNGFGKRIYTWIRRRDGSLFGIRSKHQVLINLPTVDRLMSQSYHVVNAEPMQYTIFTRIFGATDSHQLKAKLEASWKDLLKPIEEMFLNDANAVAALERGDVVSHANDFVAFSEDSRELRRWERSAKMQVLKAGSHSDVDKVEADLQSLTRDFGTCFAIPLLYGKDFLERYTILLEDFWKLDNDIFPLLMVGLPPWSPLKIMKEGVAPRARLLREMDALYRRIEQFQQSRPIDCGADMSDISNTALQRSLVYQQRGWSFEERGGGDLAILWGQNANTQPIFFWFIIYAYSTPGLLNELRQEIAPHVKLAGTKAACISTIDLQALFANCPLMKSCIFETHRMANEATSIRYVEKPITIIDGNYKHEIKPGTFISAPRSVIQRDPEIFSNPDEFMPERFLYVDPGTGKKAARYGKLKPWGVGAAMCKGRSFAEKEIMALGASIISFWDIRPAEGAWKIPTMIPGTGVKKPINDIRVRISRRLLS